MGKFGMTHADVAGALAGLWKLPEVLAQPMKHHHRPQTIDKGVARDVAEVVWLAGRCAAVFVDTQPEWSLCDVRRTCMDRYKIDELACDAMLCEVGKRTHELAPMFDVSMDQAAGGYEGVLRRANDALKNMTTALTEVGRPEDKRRSPRFARSGSLPIYPYAGGRVSETVRAEFRDASAQGVGLTVPKPLAVGSQFIIRLPRKQGEPLPILYTVVRVGKADAQGGALVGASLTSVLRAEDLGPVGAPVPVATPAPAVKAVGAPVAAKVEGAGGDNESGEERIRRAILESA
jgi:hypothetical protein